MQCPSCHGEGGYTELILDDGSGPFYDCGFCGGTGDVTRRIFYQILGYLSSIKRQSKPFVQQLKGKLSKIADEMDCQKEASRIIELARQIRLMSK